MKISRFGFCAFAFLLSACLSHFIVDGSVRLQLGNRTESCTLLSLSVLDTLGNELSWIDDAIFPGENSRVVEKDFAGTFRFRLTYQKDSEILDTIFSKSFDGGSVFLKISENGTQLKIQKR